MSSTYLASIKIIAREFRVITSVGAENLQPLHSRYNVIIVGIFQKTVSAFLITSRFANEIPSR